MNNYENCPYNANVDDRCSVSAETEPGEAAQLAARSADHTSHLAHLRGSGELHRPSRADTGQGEG